MEASLSSARAMTAVAFLPPEFRKENARRIGPAGVVIAIAKWRLPALHAHEGPDLLGPLRSEIRIRTGRQAHILASVLVLGEEVPGAGLDLDRGDLVLPAGFAEPRLVDVARRAQAGEPCL